MRSPAAAHRYVGVFPAALLLLTVTFACRADEELVIVSPHWQGIQYEFGLAFEKHYLAQTGKRITVRWRDVGGTSQIEKNLDATYKANPATSGIDIFFGGGMDPFENQKRKGQLLPHRLPADLLDRLPTHINGVEMFDPDFTYYGAALSSFGILENRRVTAILNLPPVRTWEDLAHPALNGWVSSSDLRKSGSVHLIYEIILQAYGWEKGWAVIYGMSGNQKSFLQTSSAPTKEVSAGDAAYAVSIDINGLTQQAFVGTDNVRFRIPEGVSVINPDGIAILKGAPNLAAAREFVNFVLSPAGQSLWMTPRGQPGGPVKYDISRMGVLPSLYPDDLSGLLIPLNPFTSPSGFTYDGRLGSLRWGVVNDLMGQTIIDVHASLRRCWEAIHRVPQPDRDRLVAEFSRPFITEAEASELAAFWRTDKIRAGRIANAWMAAAHQRYHQLRAEAESLTPPTRP
jgi:ABC-type Fe3+ transport system substrate-binding protein